MMLFARGRSSFSGRESYRQVELLIKSGKEICIISPYIDAYYAAFIRKYAGRKRFYIISSSITEPARRILESKGSVAGVALFAAVAVALDLALYVLGLLYPQVVLVTALAVIARYMAFRIWGGNHARLRSPGTLVHTKLYLSEKMVITGSANLTYRGMRGGNIEHIEVARDPGRIKDARREFWKIWEES